MAGLVETTYANALFETSKEQNNLNDVYNELLALKNILEENGDYVRLYASPVVSNEAKQELLSEAFAGKLSTTTLNFLRILIDNSRFGGIVGVSEEFMRICDDHNNIINVTAVTAVEMSSEQAERLKEKLQKSSNKNVRLETKVDSTIIGGIMLYYKNTLVDATLKTRLGEIKQAIKQKTM